MDRRTFLKTTSLPALASVVPTGRTHVKSRPNFIVIIADDMAWDDAGCYGHPHIKTPNIDRLAKQGLRFTNAFLTTSSCSPSRCSIMTGRYPHSTGAPHLHDSLPADQVVFAGLLKQAGYYTASAGKWHLGADCKKNFDTVYDNNGPSGCDKWTMALQDVPDDKPFFLWLAAIDPHRGYQQNTIKEPHTQSDAVVPPYLPENDETRKDLALYYDEISRMDRYMGDVLNEVDRMGIAENTFILFMSDNGRPFPRCKTTLYDSGVKTPFIIKMPGQTEPKSITDSLVSSVDIAPTLLDLAGVKQSPTFQGKSFAPILCDPKASVRDYVFAERNWHDYQSHERMVRSKDYLYITNAFPELPHTPPADAVRSITYQKMRKLRDEGNLDSEQMHPFNKPRVAEELYDVRNDPHQLTTLVANKKHREALNKMRIIQQKWAKRTNDSVPASPRPDEFDRETGKRLKTSK